MTFQPIKKQTTVYEVVKQIEDSIISGKLKIGSKLPSERQLAELFQVSRPVVREALIVLKGKGLVNMFPGKGNFINDFRIDGSLPILESLISFQADRLEPKFIESLCATRKLIETETAALAAINRKKEELEKLIEVNNEEYRFLEKLNTNNLTDSKNLSDIKDSDKLRNLDESKNLSDLRLEDLVELDFAFHHKVAIASGNLVYPLLLNSFKKVYTFLTSSFFNSIIKKINDKDFKAIDDLTFVIENHKNLIDAINNYDSKSSKKIMLQILEHGEMILRKSFFENQID
jgi:fatty acid metabolism transcriptional regulator FadR